jgi:hypothetical protein
MSEESSLYNPGFLGAGGFHWWVGQIADDSNWRENISDKKFDGAGSIPGWGYRYKVRIIGLHDQEEETIPSDQLPWAQVMYPVTAGGGQAGAKSTPNIRQGMFVFGFFLDGQEMEVPVIMGVLGNNVQTKLGDKIGDTKSNFSPTSGYAKGSNPDPALKVADAYIKTDAKTFKEDSVAVHELETATVKLNDLYTNFSIPLASPCKKDNSNMSNIQTTIKNLTNDINKIQQSIASPIDAASKEVGDIKSKIDGATNMIAGYMKGIYNDVAGYSIKEYNKQIAPTVDKIFPNSRHKLLLIKEKSQNDLTCTFNNIIESLPDLIGAFLNSSFGKYKDNPQSESEMISPPSPPENKNGWQNLGKYNGVLDPKRYINVSGIDVNKPINLLGNVETRKLLPGFPNSYNGEQNDAYVVTSSNNLWIWVKAKETNDYLSAPEVARLPRSEKPYAPYENRPPQRKSIPICSVESLVGNILGATLPEITKSLQTSVNAVNSFSNDYVRNIATIGGGIDVVTQAGILIPINASNIMSPSANVISNQSSVNDVANSIQNSISSATDTLSSISQSVGNVGSILGRGKDSILINKSGASIVQTASQVVNLTGTENITSAINQASAINNALSQGDIFGAAGVIGGDIGDAAAQAQNIINRASQVSGQAQQLLTTASSLVEDIAGNLTSALGFVNGVVSFFKCDPDPLCPESLGYRFHDGSEGKAQGDKPNNSNAAAAAESTPSPPPQAPPKEPFATPRQDGVYNPSTQTVDTNSNSVTSDGRVSSLPVGQANAKTQRAAAEERELVRNSLELF